jgi:uncharacterized protein YggE
MSAHLHTWAGQRAPAPTPGRSQMWLLLCVAPLLGCFTNPAAAAYAPATEHPALSAQPVIENRAAMPQDTTEAGTLRVSGRASVAVTPDRANLRFAIETEAPTAAQAATTNADGMASVIAAVRGLLGQGGELGTDGYVLSPVYRTVTRNNESESIIVGYRAVNHVRVTLHDLNAVGPVLDAAIGAGANRVSQLSFFASNTEPARLEAIARATASARAEAEALARALGGELDAVLEVSVSAAASPSAQVSRMVMLEASTPIEPGSQQLDVSVSITYRLRAPLS